ncbi:acetoin:2,6-dichlorophenolindophenol oxidoreductase subunit alpha [bacterium BMS3Abin02]|nr:acetoin:2,6-dichlorophenolindophenol oxidoreductase subunit alpha [bacterium BMS3Abin02]GBE20870.1 acetoin:2,6-dichlorophenolindophenol oxidoreductase subunit alpha [bacterium BMS3Bbin01]
MMTLGNDTLTGLWERMVRIRIFEARVSAVAEAKQVDGYLHTYAGQEAVACGIIPLLREDDWFTSTYRNHGHAIARDIPLDAIAGEIYGKATGVCGGKGGSMHVADQTRGMIGGMGIVAGGLPIATGAALASRYLGRDSVAVAFFGDGAVHQGAWHEALDFAGLFSCPVVFVCENNLYAETTAVDYHLLAGSVAAMTAPYGIPSVQVDGMDVFSVREAGEEAIARARNGEGPSLIEAMTYRYGGQYEGDTQTYKPPKEVAWWRDQDPLLRFRASVAGQVDSTVLDTIEGAVAEEVAAAFDAAERAPWPDLAQVTADVYTPTA